VRGSKATEQVRAALANIEGLEIDYSEPLDLVVVSPSG
jgi:nitrate reductase NapAB chaperone NapD